MVHTEEYLNEESVAQLNELAEKANLILGKDTIKLQNNKEMSSCIDVYFDGDRIYDPADECEAAAFLEGIVRAYDKLKDKKRKDYAVVNTYFRANNIGKRDPIFVGLFNSFKEAKIAFEDEKKAIQADGYDSDEVIIDTDQDDLWVIQQDDWDDWDSLKIVEVEKTENTNEVYVVYKTQSNEDDNDNFPEFVCVSGNEKVAKQAFVSEKQKIVNEVFGYGEEKFYLSVDTENEWQINSDVFDTWVKLNSIRIK